MIKALASSDVLHPSPVALTYTKSPQVQMQIEARYVSDILRGDDSTEMQITLLRYIDDEMPPDDE